MFKRLSAIILALCMLVSVAAGCSNTTTTTEVTSDYIISGDSGEGDTQASASGDAAGDTGNTGDSGNTAAGGGETVTQQNIKNPLDVNLKGATITIYSMTTTFDASRKASSKSDQAHISMLKSLQKKLNCKIVNKTTTAAQLQSSMFTTLSSGKSFANLVQTYIHATSGLVSNKLVMNLKNVSTMDLTKDYLDVGGAVAASTYGGGTWYVAEANSIFNRAQGVFFNKRILEEIGMKDSELYSLVDKKQWTYAKMRELSNKAVKDLDGKSGMTIADRWGLSIIDIEAAFAPSIMNGLDAHMLITDANGNVKFNTDSQNVIDAINFTGEWINKDPGTCRLGSSDDDRRKIFTEGKALFFYGGAADVTHLSDMEDDFGFLPFPTAKEGGEYKAAVNWNTTVLLIPKGLDKTGLANSGSFLQAYSYMCQDVNQSTVEDYSSRYFRDDESGENFKIAAAGQKITLSQGIAVGNEPILCGTYRVMWDLYNTSLQTPVVSHIQETKSAAVKAIDELMAKLK